MTDSMCYEEHEAARQSAQDAVDAVYDAARESARAVLYQAQDYINDRLSK